MRWFNLFIVFSFLGCSSSTPVDFNDFEKMLGQWKSIEDKTVFIETWEQEGARLVGSGYMLQGKDTAFGEKLIVELVNDKLVYIADVKGQNPVMFTCTAQTSGSWIFENTDHDFPNKISYNLISPHKLTVILEGTENGNPMTEKLNFNKVANE
jgi:Domain of unknown function (DUF6265)